MKKLKKFMALGLAATMLMTNATSVFAGETNFSSNETQEKNVSDWQIVDNELFTEDDYEIQVENADDWKMLEGETGTATFVNTTTTTKLTVQSLQICR